MTDSKYEADISELEEREQMLQEVIVLFLTKLLKVRCVTSIGMVHITSNKVYTAELGQLVQKQVNVNPELNVNCSIIFCCLKMFFTSNVWCSLRLLQLKTEGQTLQTEINTGLA